MEVMLRAFFREDIANLANANLYVEEDDPVQIEKVEISDNYDYPVFDSVNSFSFVGGSLVLNSNIDLKLYYQIDSKDWSGKTRIIINNNEEITPICEGNIMCLKIADINVSELDDVYNLKFILPDRKGVNQQYGVMTYMLKVLEQQDNNDKLVNLIKALYNYNRAAKEYCN